MTREESWQVTGNTLEILRQIDALGLIVSVHRLSGSILGTSPAAVEMHALNPGTIPPKQFIARVPIDAHKDPECACAVLLEDMVGTDLFG